jgi:hypothetical protein
MRRSLIAVAAVVLSGCVAGPAAAALSITPGAVRMLVPPASGGGDPTQAYAARAGGTYRFEVAYRVAGARRIGTGHLFVFENAVTGERLVIRTKSFAPEPPGPYRESSELTIPASWAPGVYRLRWTISARNPRLESVRATGTRVFLMVG